MRLTFLCHAATRSMREGGFPAPDEPIDEGGERKARALDIPTASIVLCSPAHASRQTLQLVGLAGAEDRDLRDIGYGDWIGRSFAAVHESDPDGLAQWLADPTGAMPGGESFGDLIARLTPWLAGIVEKGEDVLAITHPMVIRAVLTVAIGAPADVALRIDCGPMTQVELSFNRLWRLKSIRPH